MTEPELYGWITYVVRDNQAHLTNRNIRAEGKTHQQALALALRSLARPGTTSPTLPKNWQTTSKPYSSHPRTSIMASLG